MSLELQDFPKDNPWLKLKNGLYALEEEQNAVHEFNQNHKNHPLFTGLPPQPFQGNPKAPVWILMLNPCYSENDEKYYNDVDKKARKNAILAQVKFEKIAGNHWHYVLDNSENNFSRKWFEKHFIKNKEMGITAYNVDEKIFILQAFGYASEKFNGNLNKMVESFPHMKFAQELARWGLKNGKKIVIARCKDYWLNVLEAEKHPENFNNIYFFSSPQNISFSAGNIVNWYEYQLLKENSAAKLQVIIKN